jgi:hypothetical protein
MRSFITLLEDAGSSGEPVTEGPILNRLANKALGAIGNKRAQGRVQRDTLAKQMQDGFSVWVGKTNRKGTADDVQQYLQMIGFEPKQAQEILGQHAASGAKTSGQRQEPTVAMPAKTGAPTPTPTPTPTPAVVPPSVANPQQYASGMPHTITTNPAPAKASAAPAANRAPGAPLGKNVMPPVPPHIQAAADNRAAAANNTAPPQPGEPNWDRRGALSARQTAADLASHHAKLRDQNIAKANSYTHPDAKAKPQARANYHHSRSQEFSKERDQHTANIRAHDSKIAGNQTESTKPRSKKLVELQIPSAANTAIRGKDLANIFSSAAAYAHDKDMVSSKVQTQTGVAAAASVPPVGPSPGGGNTSGGYNPGSASSFDDNVAQYYQNQRTPKGGVGTTSGSAVNASLLNKMVSHLDSNGMSAEAIQKLRQNLQSMRSYSKVPANLKEPLAQVGFAFLKSV